MISHESWLARELKDAGPSTRPVGSALISSSADLFGGHLIASSPRGTPSLQGLREKPPMGLRQWISKDGDLFFLNQHSPTLP